MKNKVLYLLLLAGLFTACAKSYLQQEPQGGTYTEDQYKQLEDMIKGTTLGVYYRFYEYGGDHDSFGKKSFDMYGDLLSGDMAMNTRNYGWFETDERGNTYQRAASFWYHYYQIIRSCNRCLNMLEDKNIKPTLEIPEDITDEMYEISYYYGEILALRGYAYACLQRYFCRMPSEGVDYATELSVPIYTEEESRDDSGVLGMPRVTADDVYLRIEDDLNTGIKFMETYYEVNPTSKIEINADIAKLILAYAYINRTDYEAKTKADGEYYEKAYKLAKEVIDSNHYRILPNDKMLTTGFASVDEDSWMWGEDVSIETSTSLASFFGQCDIHSYSYAWAGDVKGIDKTLYESIPSWDGRKHWWLGEQGYPNKSSFIKSYAWAPEGKFFSPKYKKAIESSEIDREWLCDIVYMRIELAYMIAAEAALFKTSPDLAASQSYLDAIMSQRLDTAATAAADYAAYKGTLTDEGSLLAAIEYNWRIELWGEGYGLQTFRRLTRSKKLGDNHLRTEKEVNYSTPRMFTFEIPSSEYTYNPAFRESTKPTQLIKK